MILWSHSQRRANDIVTHFLISYVLILTTCVATFALQHTDWIAAATWVKFPSLNIHVTRGKVSCPRTEIRIRTANSDWDSNSHPFQITATSFFFFFWGVNHYGNDILAPSNSCRPSPEKLVSSCSVSALWWTEHWGFSSGTAQSAVSRKRAQLKPVAKHAAVENSHWSASGLVGLY